MMTTIPAKMAETIDMPFGMWTWVCPRNYLFGWIQIPTGRGIFEGMTCGFSRMPPCTVLFPVVLTLGFPHMLSTIIPIGRLQKQLSVTLIFQMKNPAMWPLIKSIWPLVIIFTNAKIVVTPL